MTEKAVFGGGCFWCTEAVFNLMKGVSEVYPGYAGGTVPNPTYEQVCTGDTGHAEVVVLEYDPAVVSYKDLLTVFFASHNPTEKNKQENDVGTQYRSVVFYTNDSQKKEVLDYIEEINSTGGGVPIVTEVEPFTEVYKAESYHKDYFTNHSSTGYCQLIIEPKLEKVEKRFGELLKKTN
ncbi:MAG: peptide-methionine (S)-S-oxide reductase MsrA [Minisyncoccota bacterium]